MIEVYTCPICGGKQRVYKNAIVTIWWNVAAGGLYSKIENSKEVTR